MRSALLKSPIVRISALASTGALLVGGAATYSLWTDSATVPDVTLDSGQITIDTPTCTGGWTFVSDESAWLTTSDVVPGSVITQTCTTDVTVIGNDASATLSVTDPSWTGSSDLSNALVVDTTFTVDGTSWDESALTLTEADSGKTVEVVMTVTFPSSSEVANNDALTAVLGGLTISLDQNAL